MYTKMKPCNNCPYYPDFDMFYRWYGVENYADKWITDAFWGGGRDFKNGNTNFSSYDSNARAGTSTELMNMIITTGTSLTITFDLFCTSRRESSNYSIDNINVCSTRTGDRDRPM
jgi:hypothetical protein